MRRGWLKKVHQEWSILERDLPGEQFITSCSGSLVFGIRITMRGVEIRGRKGTALLYFTIKKIDFAFNSSSSLR